MLDSVSQAIQEVIDAQSIKKLTDCKKLVDYKFIYLLRIGSYRAFFSFHVQMSNNDLHAGNILDYKIIVLSLVYH